MAGRLLIVAIFVLGIGAVCLGLFAAAATPDPNPTVSLASLREQEVIFLEEHDVYMTYVEGRVYALSNDAQHPGTHEIVEYCPSSRIFEEPGHGGKFDMRGRYIGGHANRSMDGYVVEIRGDEIYVFLDREVRGRSRETARPFHPQGPLCYPL